MTEVQLTPTQIAHRVADLLFEKKATDIVVMNIDAMESSSIADYMVIATGQNRRQVQAMASELGSDLKTVGIMRRSLTGQDYGWWVLLDFGDVVVHLMQDDARRYYDLEALWADATIERKLGFAPVEEEE